MEQRGFGAMPTHRKCSCLQGRLGSYDSVLVGHGCWWRYRAFHRLYACGPAGDEWEGEMRYLTWDDLAVLYKKETGRSAKILPMDQVFNWAAKTEG
jgi:hypothetical protein